MRRSRLATAVCLLLGALALAIPAGALAGGSAGNQQYTDPFGSTTQSHQTTTQTPAAAPPPASTAAGPSAGVGTAPSDPATTADPPPAPTVTSSTGTLPYTGYALWVAAGFGITLLAAGLMLRWRTGEER